MIVYPEKKLLIMTPPHTASRAIHITLCRQFTGKMIWAFGPTPDGFGDDHHTNKICNQWLDFRVAIVVRNPFTRILGLWYHLVNWNREHGHGCDDFKVFVQRVARDDETVLSWLYRYTITRWLGTVRPDVFVHYEDLDRELSELLATEITLERTSSGNRKPSTEFYYDDETARLVATWAGSDLARFKYSEPWRVDSVQKGVHLPEAAFSDVT